MTNQNLYNLVSKGKEDSVPKETPDNETKDDTLGDLKRELKDMVTVSTLRSMMQQGSQQQAPAPAPPSPVDLKMSLDLGQMITSQAELANAANRARDEATKAYFESQQQRVEDILTRALEAQKQPPPGPSQPQVNPLEIWRSINADFTAVKNELGLSNAPAGGMDAPTMITLKQMELEQTRVLQEMRAAALERQQDHQLKLQDHQLKVQEHHEKQGRGQQLWTNLIKGVGQSVKQGVSESKMETLGSTPRGIVALKCPSEGCGYAIPVPPNASQVTCPQCSEVFDVGEDE